MNALDVHSATYLSETCRLFVSITLICAAIGKSFALQQFADNLTDSFRVPSRWRRTLALGIVVLEACLAILVFSGSALATLALWFSMALFALFAVRIFIALIHNELIRCNCFGRSNETITHWDVIKNVVLIAACAFCLLKPASFPLTLIPQLMVTGVAAIWFLLVVNLHHIAMVASKPAGP